jgi:hypothetical protein
MRVVNRRGFDDLLLQPWFKAAAAISPSTIKSLPA